MIDVQHLVFEYPGVYALDDVSLHISRGDVTALVGPNGAGKTTLMRCLAALDTPISGSIHIDGVDVLADPRRTHEKIGYVPDFFGLFSELTVRQSLIYYARAHAVPPGQVDTAVQKAAGRLQLLDRLDQKTKTLSRGLSQRVAIAQAIVHEPEVLLLDEPASGLDPEARKHLADLFLELQGEGMTLIVSSHILAELETYASSMVIVRDGKIVEHRPVRGASTRGAPTANRTAATANQVLITLSLSEPVTVLADLLRGQPGISDVTATETTATFQGPADRAGQHQLLRTLIERGIPVCTFAEERSNLQDAYLSTMRAMGEGLRA